ncbi:radical SAM protein [Kitasatospora azatica]|uniref:radical SAM protein n=1 Tax=Kitasatospora azatica TaxID=58347 RepID=UPI00055DCCF0|nr:radical SAM protein [Kitasatospora azatica]
MRRLTRQGDGRRLTHAEINRIRQTRGATALLFITDRCPVGCAHCSVDSRPDSPRITDFALFEQIVDQLCADPERTMIGISGGEPFVERRGLTLAARRIADAGKELVVYTSGVWGAAVDPPAWIHEVLDHCACVYLSTDAYHEAGTGPERFIGAARVIAGHGLPIVVQVVDQDGGPARAEELLRAAFGSDWPQYAELVPTQGLPHGRGAELFERAARVPGRRLGACELVISPVVRYDGRVTACCNETVLMGGGPAALRRDCTSGAEVGEAVAGFQRDPLYRAIGTVGGGALTQHPRFRELADRQFGDICGLCWAMTKRVVPAEDNPLLRAIELVGGGARE